MAPLVAHDKDSHEIKHLPYVDVQHEHWLPEVGKLSQCSIPATTASLCPVAEQLTNHKQLL